MFMLAGALGGEGGSPARMSRVGRQQVELCIYFMMFLVPLTNYSNTYRSRSVQSRNPNLSI